MLSKKSIQKLISENQRLRQQIEKFYLREKNQSFERESNKNLINSRISLVEVENSQLKNRNLILKDEISQLKRISV